MSKYRRLTDDELSVVVEGLRVELVDARAEQSKRRKAARKARVAELRAKGWRRHVGIFGVGGWLVEHPTLGYAWQAKPGPEWRRVAFRSPSEAKRRWECHDDDVAYFWRKPAGE